MAGPETDGAQGTGPDDVVRPGTGVVRPGTGVVRPGSGMGAAGNAGVVRPGTDVVRPDTTPDGAAKAVAAVPEAPEAPLEPIQVVLPVIPVKEVKQGFLDRLVAGKTEAEKAEEAVRKEEEARRKAEEAQRKAEEKARQKEAEAQRKAAEKARAEAQEARREAREADRKARAEAEERAEKERRERERAEEKARREQERLRAAQVEELEEEEDERAPAVAPRPAPPRPAPGPGAPPRPAARPAPARPMPRPDRRGRGPQRYEDDYAEPVRARRPAWHWAVGVVALAALGGGSAAVAGVVAPPPTVVYQAGIDTGRQAPVPGVLDGNAPMPTRAGLESALASLVATTNLGPSPAVTVADAATGQVLWDRNGGQLMKPASSAKILTAAAVLAARGPLYRISTKVVAGANPGDVVLVGAGDPTLAKSDGGYFPGAGRLDELAEQVLQALGGAKPSRVLIDGSFFAGPTIGPSGPGNVSEGQVVPITALMINGGRPDPACPRSDPQCSHPDVVAGRAFATALGLPSSAVSTGRAPGDARVLGEVLSPPIGSIVEEMLSESDNTVAEVMARQVADAKGMERSFAGGAQATRAVLDELGVPMPSGAGLVDGSGLSHDDRVTTNHLTAVLHMAASPQYPQLRPILSGLAVAGYSGTMDNQHGRSEAGAGVVRAKTGTLKGVNALAGLLVDADGRLLIFAAIGNNTPNEFVAEPALDRIAERLTRCGCS